MEAVKKKINRVEPEKGDIPDSESVQKSVSKEKFNNNITFDIWKKRKKAIEHDWKI
jgi:hypothetical protein